MERRKGDRQPYRTQVRFTERGTEKALRGYSTNISSSGLFMTTNGLVGKGRRVRLELGDNRGNVVEGVVTRVSHSLHSLRPSGLAVRFLSPQELVAEILEKDKSGDGKNGDGKNGDGKRPATPKSGLYRLKYADRRQLTEIFKRDLSSGGLFIPSEKLAGLNEVIIVELEVTGVAIEPVRFEARVVQRLEPGLAPMAGLGVEILDLPRVIEALRPLILDA